MAKENVVVYKKKRKKFNPKDFTYSMIIGLILTIFVKCIWRTI